MRQNFVICKVLRWSMKVGRTKYMIQIYTNN